MGTDLTRSVHRKGFDEDIKDRHQVTQAAFSGTADGGSCLEHDRKTLCRRSAKGYAACLVGRSRIREHAGMKVLVFLVLLSACFSPPLVLPIDSTPDCEQAANMSAPRAFRRVEELAELLEVRTARLELVSAEDSAATPEEVDTAGEELGVVIGELWVLCSCHEQLAITEDCQQSVEAFEYWLD